MRAKNFELFIQLVQIMISLHHLSLELPIKQLVSDKSTLNNNPKMLLRWMYNDLHRRCNVESLIRRHNEVCYTVRELSGLRGNSLSLWAAELHRHCPLGGNRELLRRGDHFLYRRFAGDTLQDQRNVQTIRQQHGHPFFGG